jgi:hypothetical protein
VPTLPVPVDGRSETVLIHREGAQADARLRRVFADVFADVFPDLIACLKEARNGSASSCAQAFVR